MATIDFTEHPVIDRETASRLNPFISSFSDRDTMWHVQEGLEFLGLVAFSTNSGGSDLTAGGLTGILSAMSIAMAFEIETARVEQHRHLETHAQEQGGAL